jgi:hypothetical protein
MDKIALLTDKIDSYQLSLQALPLSVWELSNDVNWKLEDLASQLWKGGPRISMSAKKRIQLSGDDPRPPKSYWVYVRNEFHTMLCTDSQEYEELWVKLNKLTDKSAVSIVALTSAYIGAKLGLEGALISQFVAICIYGASKLGKNAFCNQVSDSNA